jgi:hypothetical protein
LPSLQEVLVVCNDVDMPGPGGFTALHLACAGPYNRFARWVCLGSCGEGNLRRVCLQDCGRLACRNATSSACRTVAGQLAGLWQSQIAGLLQVD